MSSVSQTVLHLPAGTRWDQPRQLVFQGDKDCRRKLHVTLEAGASAQVIVCDYGASAGDNLSRQTEQEVEIHLGPGASLEYYDIEESGEDCRRSSHITVRQAEASNLLLHAVTLHNGHTQNHYRIDIEGERADCAFFALAVLDNEQRVETHTRVVHATPRSKSHELVKSVLRGQASSVFNGHILVAPGAEKTHAGQTNRSLCLSPTARASSSPQLEIYADDVHCSHGMSAGQLDHDALFYMRSRGIPHHQALLLLSIAFIADILNTIRIDTLKERIRDLVEKHFH
ncbi:MAG: SufD family Fe-S cluster assembly protein [Tannerellaceae bacterium]|nr:SufD family Fe-S cluster assembly protein [Tannerellaceae bacterium]